MSFFIDRLAQFQYLGTMFGSQYCLKGLACVLAQHPARAQQSVQLFAAASVLLGAINTSVSLASIDQLMDHHLAELRAHLDYSTFAAAWAEGQTMTLEQAIAYALGEGD